MRKVSFFRAISVRLGPKGQKKDQEGVNVCLGQRKISFLSKKFNSLVKLTLEPARLLRAWQCPYRATGDCTTGRTWVIE